MRGATKKYVAAIAGSGLLFEGKNVGIEEGISYPRTTPPLAVMSSKWLTLLLTQGDYKVKIRARPEGSAAKPKEISVTS